MMKYRGHAGQGHRLQQRSLVGRPRAGAARCKTVPLTPLCSSLHCSFGARPAAAFDHVAAPGAAASAPAPPSAAAGFTPVRRSACLSPAAPVSRSSVVAHNDAAATSQQGASGAGGNGDAAIAAVQQQLEALNEQAKQLAGELKTARDAWLKADPASKKDYKEAYEDLKAEIAKLVAMRKDLQAQLTSGTLLKPAPLGPVVHNLDQLAPELADEDDNPYQDHHTCFRLHGPGISGGTTFYIDYDRTLIREVDAWLDHCYGCIVDPNRRINPPAAFFNGLPKTGKTMLLNDILPARLRAHPYFGVHKSHEVLLLKLNVKALNPSLGYAAMLRTMLSTVMGWLVDHSVPIRARVWNEAVAVASAGADAPWDTLQLAILDLLRDVTVPMALLIDEIQSFFLARDGPYLDLLALEAAREFFKTLLTTGPRTMLVAGTGSSMATFFVNLSMTSPHGTSLMTHSRLINLPPIQGFYAMLRCWDELKKAYPVHEHEQLLFKLAGDTTPATLVNMAQGWRESRGGKTILQYVHSYHIDKLLAEASEDWHYALQLLDKVQGQNLLNLATVDVGLDMGLFNRGLVAMLLPFTRPVAPGSSRVCLDSSLHCELIQSLLTPEGDLRQVFQGMPVDSTLEGLHAQRMLLKLGNAVVAAEKDGWASPGYLELKKHLQTWSEDVVTRCPLDRWPDDQDWFQRVLQSEYNQQGARQRWEKMWGKHVRGEQVLELWQVVAQYSRMARNCLGHAEFEDEIFLHLNNGLPHLYDLNDVDIVASWPFAPSVGRIPAVIGPIASKLKACSSSSSGGGSGGSSSSSGTSGTSGGSGSSTIGSGSRSGSAVPALMARRWPAPLQRRDLRGVKIGMPPRPFRGSGLQAEVEFGQQCQQ